MKASSRMGLSACLLAASVFAAGTAHPADKATQSKMEELEQRQEQLDRELRELRQEMKKEEGDDQEVERRQGILTEELRRLRDAITLPETRELKSAYGLGPAASKVYGLERGLSIAGYGEANFKNVVSDKTAADGKKVKDEFDFLRLVLYLGYKFNDWILFNSETEFEHASTGKSGEVSVEFATLDFMLHPMANVRGGLLLVPMGFLNEVHEPPFFHGNVRPPVETQILPTTWRANGFGLFGELAPELQYRTYGLVSLDAKKFSSSGIRGGRQSGSKELADDWSWVARLDYSPIEGLTFGGSTLLGDQGQEQSFAGKEQAVFLQMYEAHAQLHTHGLELRALGAVTDLDDARHVSAEVGKTVADTMLGWYTEIAYDVLSVAAPDSGHYLAPWFRYSRFDTQNSVPAGLTADDTQDREVIEFGLSYKPIPQVVLKADYHIQDASGIALPDELRLGGGFVF